jgi:Galactose oxidase, central domain
LNHPKGIAMKTTHNGFVLAFLMSAFLLVACGGGGGSNTPPASTYTLSGQVRNIPSGAAFVLQNNGGDNLIVPAGSTSFNFVTKMMSGVSYNVSVLTQPTNPVQNCTVSNGTGTVSATDVSNVIVDCSWAQTGSSSSYRDGHTATLLPNGKVLMVGGSSDTSLLSSAELYDPATGLWTPTGSLATARINHTAILLPSGKVLVVGGTSGSTNLSSAELYDPTTQLWTPTGSLATALHLLKATLLNNGKVLVSGGGLFV